MLAFAGNSILCRMALRDSAIDPASFTSIRLLSGALALLLIVRLTSKDSSVREHGSWTSAFVLFIYAACFSYAYISLSAGAGALILFGFVQGTMIAMALWSGDRPNVSEWLGWLLAFGGLIWLLIPGIEAPATVGASLMGIFAAGVAIPFLLAAFFFSRMQGLFEAIGRHTRVVGAISTSIIVAFGVLLITDNFHTVSDFVYPYLGLE